MKNNNLHLFLLILLSITIAFSCSKSNESNPKEDTNSQTNKNISLNIVGLKNAKNQRQLFVWIYKDEKFYDTLSLDSSSIMKGSFQKSLPMGSYQFYAASKNGKFKILAQTAYQQQYGGTPPSFNIYIPLTANGKFIYSSKLVPQINFQISHVSSRSYTDEAFYDYFVCNETKFLVNSNSSNVDLNFKRLGGQLTI